MRKSAPQTPELIPYSDSLWEEFSEADVADIVVDIDAPDLQPTYTYRVPVAMQNTLQPGDCVRINFSGRETLGYVFARRKLPLTDPLASKLRDIQAIVEDAITINAEQMQTVRWMSEHYVCDLLDAIRCVVPTVLGGRVSTKVVLKDASLRGVDVGGSIPQAHLIETLRSLGGEAERDLLRETAHLNSFSAAYAALLKSGLFIETTEIARAQVVTKKVRGYALGAAADSLTTARRSEAQQRLLNALVDHARRSHGPVPSEELLREAQAGPSSLKGLVEKGLVVVSELVVRRAPTHAGGKRTVAPVLSPGQANATTVLRECIESGEPRTVLLFGVTASGKTEVYLDAIAHTLTAGRSAIVLLPEIALTTQVVDVFIGRFGEQVAVLHSKLSEGERHDEWRRMQRGEARIVVGARSAIFAPVSNVGLIVVDEEHEASYKQEKTPRYNAKELAMERARLSRATLVLGSATPAVESYYLATEAPKKPYTLITMPDRISNRPLPQVEIVDLRAEFKQRQALFSSVLTDALGTRLAKKQQAILFLNRRGYAQFVLCRDCGWVAKCPNCAVSLAFHAYDRMMKCHHCDYSGRAPQACPDCGSGKVKAFGIGTEKVEEEVLKIFPSARVARMDRDTTARKGAHSRILREFREGDADILIGTQMVAKGLDFPNVTLVGVISADTSINMPDFRAAERTFQLLTQVAGRAGRGDTPGEVIIQTFSPDHYAVQAAVTHDFASFYAQEIVFRKELKYPPFSRFANLIAVDVREDQAAARAEALAAALERETPKEVEIIGPAPAPIARLKNQYRFHVALRAPVETPLSEMIRAALTRLSPADRFGIHIDMDPLSMA